MINITCSEISAKFLLLSINNRFCHFKQKGYYSHFSSHRNFLKSEILLQNSINLQNLKQIYIKAFLILHFYFSIVFQLCDYDVILVKMATFMFITLNLDISRISRRMKVSDLSFFWIFHALSFELIFY